ncbi:MAG: hypothetical protein H5T66_15855 [Chloroflexi bacterium]|nr:hypothetical protein [Chloroflexota bacterium]
MAGSPPYLAGTVWKRGQRGREPWAGARISLLDAEGAAILQERLSGPKGEYYFGALASGLYRVFQEPLAGYEATPCYWGAVLHEGAELVIDFEHRPLSGQGAESIFLPLLSSS